MRQSDLLARRYLDYPYGVSGSGTPNTTPPDDHLRDLILQVLFTNPGERVFLPDFGAGVSQLVFAPNSDALRVTAQFLISTNLQHWLGDRINVDQVTVTSDPGFENVVTIEISYTVKATLERRTLDVQV
ncbi:MAG: GPW/gp25 family protein [Candidatus Eremiobacteraeota bacterium]|nr:GPW/gp25 family protein [Candidatus Eremiobacteraeota bacterium]MBV8370812.1 GPW/gp25 family protein [Candidatus Eremiobacteraeota bacterium]